MLIGSRGLFEIKLENNKIFSFTQKKAIPASQFVYFMKQDKQGFIWMGTDDGIYRYDPTKDEAIHFDRSDGVQSQSFNSDGALLSSAGVMYMGGRNGVNYLHPEEYKPSSSSLKPMVLSFFVDGKDSAVNSSLQIPYNNNQVSFIISAPEYKKTISFAIPLPAY